MRLEVAACGLGSLRPDQRGKWQHHVEGGQVEHACHASLAMRYLQAVAISH